MIISTNTRRASIITDEPTATFEYVGTRRESIAVAPSDTEARPARATVEILRHGGGLMPRALLGGAFTPSTDSRLVIEVRTSGSNVSGIPTCLSQLGKPLIPGLPDEFAFAVVDGFARRSLLGGHVVVDRGAFDPVESSPLSFELAAEILAIVLASEAMAKDLPNAVRAAVEAWP